MLYERPADARIELCKTGWRPLSADSVILDARSAKVAVLSDR
jgi:hypothetical protein